MENIRKVAPKSLKKLYVKAQNKYIAYGTMRKYKSILAILSNTYVEKRIIVIGTSIYGNIGDQAISIAQMKLLKDNFPGVTIIEVPVTLYVYYSHTVNKYINSDDLIILNGGGYLGTLWKEAQVNVDTAISQLKSNHIIIFPQTVYYSRNNDSLINYHRKIYANHSNLSVIVRDKKSYKFFNEHNFEFKNLILTPDIVSYLEKNDMKSSSGKVTFCLRDDKEKTDNDEQVKNLISTFRTLGYTDNNFVFKDSVIDKTVNYNNRNKELDIFLKEIGKSDFVITDRLHGLILSIICGVPVIALDNISKKVYGAYEWFQNLPYVLYYTDDNLNSRISEIKESKHEFNYDSTLFKEHHDQIINLVSQEFSNGR